MASPEPAQPAPGRLQLRQRLRGLVVAAIGLGIIGLGRVNPGEWQFEDWAILLLCLGIAMVLVGLTLFATGKRVTAASAMLGTALLVPICLIGLAIALDDFGQALVMVALFGLPIIGMLAVVAWIGHVPRPWQRPDAAD